MIRNEFEHQQNTEDAKRYIDEKVPVPAQISGDEAAKDRADDRREQRRPCNERDSGDKLGLLRIAQHDHAPDRRHQGAAHALNGTRADELPKRFRQTADERGDRKNGDSGNEDIACAEAITHPAGNRDEDGHGQHVDGNADAHRHGLDAE